MTSRIAADSPQLKFSALKSFLLPVSALLLLIDSKSLFRHKHSQLLKESKKNVLIILSQEKERISPYLITTSGGAPMTIAITNGGVVASTVLCSGSEDIQPLPHHKNQPLAFYLGVLCRNSTITTQTELQVSASSIN